MSESPHRIEPDPTPGDGVVTVPDERAGALSPVLDERTAVLSAVPNGHVGAASALDAVDEIDLGADPFGDDLVTGLRARAPLPITRTTVALTGLVLVVAGFLGGVLVEKNVGAGRAAATAGLPAGFAGRAAATPGAAGAAGNGGEGLGGGAAGGRGAATTGTVTLVDGSTIYLTTAGGDVVTVKTSATTVVRTVQVGALKSIPVGATVTVVGTADGSGIVTASQVTAQR